MAEPVDAEQQRARLLRLIQANHNRMRNGDKPRKLPVKIQQEIVAQNVDFADCIANQVSLHRKFMTWYDKHGEAWEEANLELEHTSKRDEQDDKVRLAKTDVADSTSSDMPTTTKDDTTLHRQSAKQWYTRTLEAPAKVERSYKALMDTVKASGHFRIVGDCLVITPPGKAFSETKWDMIGAVLER